jgi:FkbM family methyltransferase
MLASSRMALQFGNWLYRNAFPLYRPTYSLYKAYEDRAERRFVTANLLPGDVAVDVGANIGIYSRFLAKCVGPTGQVHSFEPSPENFGRLRAALSSLYNVRLNQLTVGDASGPSKLYVSDALNVDHRAYPSERESRRCIPINSITLDDYFRPGERVDLIKLDVQGYELHALRGSERVLRENRGIKLLLEFWPHGLRQAGGNCQDLILLLQSHGMTIRQFSKGGLQPIHLKSVNYSPEWYVNLLAYRF